MKGQKIDVTVVGRQAATESTLDQKKCDSIFLFYD